MGDETTPLGGGRGEGELLADRYRLRGRLGAGGMADVQLAEDTVLHREVAVKILHDRYATDAAFLDRFRREAQASASLNHPNVVAVYDTGEHGGRPFIVMEYVRGRSLREILAEEAVLPDRAAEIAAEAAAGLDYAHDRGLVHRDVKPGNILVSDTGQVKVTDFGIARALDAESVTETAAVFGTAAYVAPEQAQGDRVDARTDIYALGAVLYELLTGRPPFDADTAVALAYKHVSEAPLPPRQLNPDVSEGLERVCLRALAKEPDDRYADAGEMAADLQRAREGLTVAAPPPAAATARLDRTATAAAPPPADDVEDGEDGRRRRWGPIVAVIVVLLLLAAGAALLLSALLGEPPEMVQVPDVRGMHITDAQDELVALGFDARLGEQQPSTEYEPNHVIDTDPGPLELAPEGSTVEITYSEGPPLVEVPDLRGVPEEEARERLRDAGLVPGERTEETSDEVDAGAVVRTSPQAGREIPEGDVVDLVVSTGPEQLSLPDVTNLFEDDARDQLETFCGDPPCVRIRVEREHDAAEEGRVISQSPSGGASVSRGDQVTLVISRGPEPVDDDDDDEQDQGGGDVGEDEEGADGPADDADGAEVLITP